MGTKQFEGKVALVTGGNSGIGLGVAKAYAREGASVVITGRDEKTLETAAREIGAGTLAVRSDAGKLGDIENVVNRIPRAARPHRCHVHQRRCRQLRPARAGHRIVL